MSGISSALNLGKSGLLAGQKALEVTGVNIANINTPGYSREVPVFNDFPSLMMKGVAVGRGVNVSQVRRDQDVFLARQLQDKNAALGEEAGKAAPLAEVERVIGISQSSLAGKIDDFFAAWQELSGDPGSRIARDQVLQSGAQLATAFAGSVNDLQNVQRSLDSNLAARVSDLNAKFKEVADLNQAVAGIEARGVEAMAARDRRDLLLQEISYALGGTSIEGASGMVSYFLPNGLPLVHDQDYFSLSLNQVAGTTELRLQLGSQQIPLGPDQLAGELRGMLAVRDQLIPGIIADLDKLAYTLADEVNLVHRLGTGLDGIAGRDFFTPMALPAGAATSLSVALNDYRQVSAGLSGAPGDNINALALTDLGSARLVDGTQTFTDFYGQIASNLGMEISSNRVALAGNQDAMTQLSNLRDNTVGVSMEEEMVNLIRYQKSFEASAKFLTTVDDMMDTLLGIRR